MRGWAKRLAFYGAVITLGGLFLLPVYMMVKVSLSPPGEVLTPHPSFLLKGVTLQHWRETFTSGAIWSPLLKSVTVATLTMLVGIALAAPAAYVISRMGRKWKYIIVMSLLATRMIPEVEIALPVAVVFLKWNLLDTNVGLMMAHLVRSLPFVAWILIGAFEMIPRSLEEAAVIDGSSRMGVLIRVVFPLALPGAAVAALFIWLESWNEFTYALYLNLIERTLPLQTYYYVLRGSWFQSASFSVLLTIPVMLVTLLLQRYLRAGYLSGALKG